MSEFEKRRWAETAFKRLWWQGYQGRVVLFSWPTLENSEYFLVKTVWDPRNFDNSELRAWRSATALTALYQTLGPGQLRVLAHSMGNIVASEALKLHNGPSIHSYIACQAALSAQYFDNTVADLWPCPSRYGAPIPTTPDIMGHFCFGAAPDSEYFMGMGAKVANIINYYNPLDWALDIWQINNAHKPDGVYGFEYVGSASSYFPGPLGGPPPSERDWFARRWGVAPFAGVQEYRPDVGVERQVIFSYIAESRSVATGQIYLGKAVKGNWGLNLHYGYDDEHYSHSRQFRSNLVSEHEFWRKLFVDFGFGKHTNP